MIRKLRARSGRDKAEAAPIPCEAIARPRAPPPS